MKRREIPKDPEVAEAMINELLDVVERQEEELRKQRHLLDQLVKHRFGQRSDRVDPEQLSLFYEELVEEMGVEGLDAEEAEEKEKPRKKKGHGRKRLPKDLPRERRLHDVPEEEKVCGSCGKKKRMIREETTEQLEYIPASLTVIEHVQPIYACPCGCEGEVVKGEKPIQPIEKGQAGPGLLAQVVVSKYSDHLPLNRQEDIFERHGILIPKTTQWDGGGGEEKF